MIGWQQAIERALTQVREEKHKEWPKLFHWVETLTNDTLEEVRLTLETLGRTFEQQYLTTLVYFRKNTQLVFCSDEKCTQIQKQFKNKAEEEKSFTWDFSAKWSLVVVRYNLTTNSGVIGKRQRTQRRVEKHLPSYLGDYPYNAT